MTGPHFPLSRACTLRKARGMCLPVLGHADQVLPTSNKARRMEKASTADGVLEALVHYFRGGTDLAGNAERYQVLRSFRDHGFREEHVGPHWCTALPSEHNTERQLPNSCIILWRAVDISLARTLKKVEACSHVPNQAYLPRNQIKFISLQPECRNR